MSENNKWKPISSENNFQVWEMSSWRHYVDYINQECLVFNQLIFRGQRNSQWELESCLDRRLQKIGKLNDTLTIKKHLENFQLAVLGRRGPHPHRITEVNDWWALGQHHGLPSPLLDWTESPYIALYFAFEKAECPDSGFRSVYALNHRLVAEKTAYIEISHKLDAQQPDKPKSSLLSDIFEPPPPPTVQIIRPLLDESTRLISQQGLFTRLPHGTTLESWIKENFRDEPNDVILFEFRIPDIDRELCLRELNRMTINRRALFPDLEGASAYCNTKLMIDNY